MSESKSDIVKPARPAARRARKAEAPPAEEQPVAAPAPADATESDDEGFAAGIVDETPATPEPPPAAAPKSASETREPRRAEPREAPRTERGEKAERVEPGAPPSAPAHGRVDP